MSIKQVVVYDDMSNGRNFNRGAAAVLVKDITVVSDFSFIVHKVRMSSHLVSIACELLALTPAPAAFDT